jgi:uncharacterized protein (DUF4415 family)
MSAENITRVTLDPENPPQGKTDWKRLDAMTEEEVHQAALSDKDNPPLTKEELKRMKPARWVNGMKIPQESLRFRIDSDVLGWFEKKFGDSYQAGINDVLRDYISTHR